MGSGRLKGVMTPLLTPFNDGGAIAETLYHDLARAVLAAGSHYLAPFGTTGEATSIPIAARMVALERLVETGVAQPDRIVPGTGLPSLADSVFLTRHALELGVAAVLVLPPFFYMDASEDGLYRHFATLIEDIGRDDLRLCLYHIPQNTRIGITPPLTGRLARDFPGIIAGYKDSSGDWDNTLAVIEAAPDIAVFPGSESFLPQALAAGGAGCISATCNINVAQIRAAFDALDSGDTGAAHEIMTGVDHVRKTVSAAGLIPSMKAMMARKTGDDRWLTLLPPLQNADPELSPELQDILNRVSTA